MALSEQIDRLQQAVADRIAEAATDVRWGFNQDPLEDAMVLVDFHDLSALLDAAREEQKEDGEPVAWRYEYKPGKFQLCTTEPRGGQPLYAHPPRAEQPVMSREAELTADFMRSLPGGTLDDSEYEKIEDALDRLDAPMQDDKGRWLKLHERVAALASLGGRVEEDG